MPATVTCAGAAVLSGRIDFPLSGRWSAELRLATDTPPSGRVTIECAGGLSLSGAVVSSRAYQDAVTAWVVGGAGGLAREAEGAYRFAQLRDPLQALARAAGETLDSSTATSLLGLSLDYWSTSGAVGPSLDALRAEAARQFGAEVSWRFLAAGGLWMGPEAWPAASLPEHAQLLTEDSTVGVVVVGAETPTLLPGVDLAGVGRVRHVRHRIQSGEIRSALYLEASPETLPGLRIGDPAELWRLGLYRARVDACAADGSTVDLTPEDTRLSPAQGVPVVQPFPGAVVVVQAGAIVRLGWERGDPRSPYVSIWDGGSASKVVIPASTLYLGAEAGAQFVALANLVAAELDKIKTAHNTHVHVLTLSSGTGTAASPVIQYTPASVAAEKVKAK